MVESFSGNNKDSNFIEGTKIMENFSDNNENGSSIFQGKIREQDFSAEQKLNELKAAIEKLDRQDSLRRLECEPQASSCIDEISSQAELHIKDGDEGYFDCEKPLGDFWSFFEPLFNLFEVNVDDPKIYQMLKEKKEKNLIAAIMKFLCDKLKKLIKKIFESNLDLSWDKRLDKEIKELKEKLNSGELSEEELARVLERLEALQNLKLKLQMAVTGWIITMFAEMFGVELAAIVEASTEKEDKKAEKTSLKEEANKEVHKDVETKMDEREKPKVLFEVSPGFVRPVVLNKPELDLLPNSLKNILPPMHDRDISKDIEKKSEKVNEDKKTKSNVSVCPPAPKTATNTTGMGSSHQEMNCRNLSLDKKDMADNRDNNFGKEKSSIRPKQKIEDLYNQAPGEQASSKRSGSLNEGETPIKPKQKIDDFYNSFSKVTERKNDQGQEKVSSGVTDNGKSSTDQRSFASNAQENPRSKLDEHVKAQSVGRNGETTGISQ